MKLLETHELKNSTIMWINSERDEIEKNPHYQRMGGIWTLEKRQLLIDSIINNYDLPKIYFHEYTREKAKQSKHKYAIIDGRQRLETIWQFMDDDLSLSDDILVLRNPEAKLHGFRYSDLAKEHPKLKIQFDSFVLPIISVRTEDDDVEVIEDMFSRLNEAVPLNAAEKRNAIGGDFVEAVREISNHPFFNTRVKFSNSRYQHREVAARMLFTEYNITVQSRLIDTKKVWLDQMARDFKAGRNAEVQETKEQVTSWLTAMSEVFHVKDELLRAQGTMVVYMLVFRHAVENNCLGLLTRPKFLKFRQDIVENRQKAETDYVHSDFDLLEFDRLNQQGTNDASNISARARILCKFFGMADCQS